MPKTEMREVKVSRVIGRSSSTEHWRPGNSYNTNNNTKTRETVQTHIDRVWVCKGCKAPKSDGWFSNLLVTLAIISAVLYFGASYFFSQGNGTPVKPIAESEAISPDIATVEDAELPEQIDSAAPDVSTINDESPPEVTPEKVDTAEPVFAPRQEVVQPVAPPPNEYPPCSDTVTDECVDK